MLTSFRILLTAFCLAPFQIAQAEPVSCPETPVSVEAGDPVLSDRICAAARRSLQSFAACGIAIERPVTIRVTPEVPGECFAVYHCGKDVIDILAPDKALPMRRPDSAFGALSDTAFYDSIVAHELAHAAFESVPCPFGTCPATAEYLAYNMQILSLSAEDRAAVGAATDMSRHVARDEINPMLLWMAPHRFTRRVWAHLNQRDDICGYIGQIMQGTIIFDREIL